LIKIRTHLALMAGAILLPMVIFSGVALNHLLDGEREAALHGLHETARATALIVDRELGSALAALEVLATSPSLETDDLEGFYQRAKPLSRGRPTWTIVFDENAQQVVNTVVPFGAPLPNGNNLDIVRQVMATQKPYVSDLQLGPVSKQQTIMLFLPVPAHGGKRYVLVQVFTAEFFKAAVSYQNTPPAWVVRIIGQDGRYIARNHRPQDLLGRPSRPELIAAARASDTGLLRHKTQDGTEVYDAFAHSDIAGWTIAVAAPAAAIAATAGRAVMIAALGLLLALGLAAGMAAFWGGRMTRAIGRAARAASALGLGAIPKLTSSRILELDQLHAALTEASALLKRSQASRLKAEVEREALLQRELKARLRAEDEVVAKDHFLAMLGHELRNPLAAISGALALTERYDHGTLAAAEARAVIQRQSWHLSHLVDDLLDVSRMASGKITLKAQPLDLGAMAHLCLKALRATGRTEGHDVKLATEPVWIHGDPTRLEQIVNNLLVNAFKFTAAGGLVKVTVGSDAGQAVLTVTDSGIGISPGLLPHIFEVFVQGNTAPDRAQGGLGIGLALVHQLVLLHGGTVSASSAGTGQGSTFVVRLPRIATPAAPPVPALPDSTERWRWRILLIEDNEDARRMLSRLLQMEGHEVLEAPTATAGLRLAGEQLPDLAIVDIGLPEMTGYEVAEKLRANAATRNIGLIAMTGYGQEQDRVNALAAGFDFHLVKSVDINRLLDVIAQCGQAALLRDSVAEAA
jgi:signal transduction histidine kinase/ActR/RegA family two-component response regulator